MLALKQTMICFDGCIFLSDATVEHWLFTHDFYSKFLTMPMLE